MKAAERCKRDSLVLVPSKLGDPQHDGAEHDAGVPDDVLDAPGDAFVVWRPGDEEVLDDESRLS